MCVSGLATLRLHLRQISNAEVTSQTDYAINVLTLVLWLAVSKSTPKCGFVYAQSQYTLFIKFVTHTFYT